MIVFSKKQLKDISLILALCVLGNSLAYAKLLKPEMAHFANISSFLTAHDIHSVDEYVFWLKENVNYSADSTKDDWADPIITLNNKAGDCEDLAFLNAEVVKYFGYEPRVLAYGHGKEAHVICLFIMDGKYYIFDNTKFYRDIQAPSLKEIFLFLVKKHEARFLLELKREPKKLNPLYVYKDGRIPLAKI